MPDRVVIGVDIQPVDEVEASLRRFGDRYRRLLFTDEELEYCGEDSRSAQKLAARFAAKEAVLKILDVADDIPSWRSIEVKFGDRVRPEIVLRDAASRLAKSQGITDLAVSFDHAVGVATAVVMASLQQDYEAAS